MESTKNLKLRLIEQILSCENPDVLRTALQLLQTYTNDEVISSPSDRALHQALLGESSSAPTSNAGNIWSEEAVADLQRSINEVFGS